MKKEYLILAVVILVLSAYLFFHKGNQDNYLLPEITKIDKSKITALAVEKEGKKIEFTKQGETWTLTDKKYPANMSRVNDMLDLFSTLKLSALVSEKEDFKRYELDESKTIKATALGDGAILLAFDIGKTAPTYNHTFVKLTDDKNVYHANENFRSHFDKSVDDFRDKKVLEFKEPDITTLTLEKDGITKKLVANEKESKEDSVKKQWAFEDGSILDKEVLSDLLSSLALLDCDTYETAVTKQEMQSKPFAVKIIASTTAPQ
ncbi:MAG: DUF4340 domain-containing protein, partial [Desulfobacteraceae bacterium]|nr:DUF4340 domain-containing protein [Desulfobacteraceae bacterium]